VNGTPSDRVTVYRREPARRLAHVIVYLTADGRMTDFDIAGDWRYVRPLRPGPRIGQSMLCFAGASG
jgi:hypothetical protein